MSAVLRIVSAGPGVTLTFLCALILVMNAVRYLVQWIHHVAEILKVNRMIHRIHRGADPVGANRPCARSSGRRR